MLLSLVASPVSAQRREPELGYVTQAHPRCDYFVINSSDYFLLQYLSGVRPQLFDWTRDTLDSLSLRSATIEVLEKGSTQVWIEGSYSRSRVQEVLARRCGFDNYDAFFSDMLGYGLPAAAPAPMPPATVLPRPTDSDLRVTLTSVEPLGDSSVSVRGRVCNNATGWTARDVEVRFYYRDRDSLRRTTSRTADIDEVRSGDCESFSRLLLTLYPARQVDVDEVTWRWDRE
jgi:hypothetical protein